MRIDGYWLTCDDGTSRPVVDGYVVGLNDAVFYERFLVDIGADRTVFSAHLARKLALPTATTSAAKVVGVGGEAGFVLVKTVIQVLSDKGTTVRLKGEFAAFEDDTAIDLSVMGRDLLNHFDCLVSHRNAEVILLAPNHRYVVVPG